MTMAAKKKAKRAARTTEHDANQKREIKKYHELRRYQIQLDRQKSIDSAQWREQFAFLSTEKNQSVTQEDMKALREYGSALALAHLIDTMQGLVPDTTPAQRLEAAKLLRTGRKADDGGDDGQTEDDPEEMRKILAEAERRKAGTARDLE